MKKLRSKINKTCLFLLLITLLTGNNKAQTYRQLFDKKNNTTAFKPGYSNFSNIDTKLGVNSDVMQAYINMYKATKDLKYLYEFVIWAKRTMDRRDIQISSASPVSGFPIQVDQCSVSQITSPSFVYNTGYPAWSRFMVIQDNTQCVLTPFPHFMDTGGLTYPLGMFVLLVNWEEPNLKSVMLPTGAAFGTVDTFEKFANWLKDQIYAALDWQIQQDYNRVAHGCWDCDAFVSKIDGYRGINQQCAIGKSLALMHYIARRENGDPEHYPNHNSHEDYNTDGYYWYIENMEGELWTDLQNASYSVSPVGNNLPWYTWCHAYTPQCDGGLVEDISHAHIDEEFAELCAKYIPDWFYNDFHDSDMEKFANGLAFKMIPQPLRFTMNVAGSDASCDQMCGPSPQNRYHIAGIYPFLSKYNKQIYQQISDFFVPDNYNSDNTSFFSGNNPIITLQAYANLALNEHLFNPIAAKGDAERFGQVSSHFNDWYNSASGDFNNDGSDEFAAVGYIGFQGLAKVYSLSSGDVINEIASFNASPYGLNDIAGGNFDPTNGGDEITILNNSNIISLLKLNGSNLITFGSSFTPPETIVSLSSGDFNNDGKDEIVALSNSHVFIYQVSLGNITPYLSFAVSSCIKVAVGKYDGNANEIAVLNSTGGMSIYNTTGTPLYWTQAPSGTYSGMAAGDYDGDGISEIMTYGSTDGNFRIFKVRNGTLSYSVGDEEVFPLNQQQGVMCSCRLANYSDKDALVTFRNFDDQVNVFTLDGQCPNLYLNNQTINSSSYPDAANNNFPIGIARKKWNI
jgi:hypothetical protein